jgi:protein-disulfide isomerase
MKPVILLGAVAAFILSGPQVGQAQDLRGQIESVVKNYLATHPDEVGEIVKSYLIAHPQALDSIVAEALKRRSPAVAGTAPVATLAPRAVAGPSASIASNAPLLFASPHQVTLGNPNGDITLVEFFDYSCGFCKRALPDMLTLLKDDPKLKIVLKEYPILGPGSTEAARVAVAVRMQDPGGRKYLAFHQALLGDPGPASKEKALAAANAQGLDMARLQQDMASNEVGATLAESTKLADALGIRGTPGYVIGDVIVPGAIGIAALQERIAAARARMAN